MEGLGESHPFFFLPLPPVSNDLSDDHARIMVSRLGGGVERHSILCVTAIIRCHSGTVFIPAACRTGKNGY